MSEKKKLLLFPQCFLLKSDNCTPFVHTFDIFLFAAELKDPKIGKSDKGLNNTLSNY